MSKEKETEKLNKQAKDKDKEQEQDKELEKELAKLAEFSNNKISPKDIWLCALAITLKKKLLTIIIMTVIFALCSALICFYSAFDKSEATMTINYGQIINGLAPNETRFNISAFSSNGIMNGAIERAGLAGKITPEELSKALTVNSVSSQRPIGKGSYYIPTSYRILYKNPDSIKSVDAKNMLSLICDVYEESFYENYTQSTRAIETPMEDFSDMEYSQIASYLSCRIDTLIGYLNMRSNEGGKFKSSEGTTFSSLKKRAENLKDYTLKEYEAYIWEKGVVREENDYKHSVNILQGRAKRNYQTEINEYEIRRAAIDYYHEKMLTAALIPTIRDNEFYMAKTKIGVDYLANEAEFYLQNAQDIAKKISYNDDKFGKIQPTQENNKVANEMIKKIEDDLKDIEKLTISTDKEYITERERNYLNFDIKNATGLNRKAKRNILLLSGLFFMILFLEYYRITEKKLKRGTLQ